MSKSIPIELDNGTTVNVFPVPPHIIQAVFSNPKFREPDVPMRKVDPEVSAVVDQEIPDPDNPEYKRQVLELRKAQMTVYDDTRLLYGLAEVKVPEGWPTDRDSKRLKKLGLAENIPTEDDDPDGRLLLYIKFGMGLSGVDLARIHAAIDSFADLNKEEVDQLIDSFRNLSRRDKAK